MENTNTLLQNLEETLTSDSPLFGWNQAEKDSQLVIIPAPWEPTTSFKGGTSFTPELIRQASHQMDYFHEAYEPHVYQKGIYYRDIDPKIADLHEKALSLCDQVQSALETDPRAPVQAAVDEVNQLSQNFNHIIYQQAKSILEQKKTPALFGGDHSTPYGLMKALSEEHSEWSILHIDAHFDLRQAYQGFEHSHASILYNASQLPNAPKNIVHLGIRDFAQSEYSYALKNGHIVWTDRRLSSLDFAHQSWDNVTEQILSPLNKNVYISFDIDGLDPSFCPGTGTPVPGGLSYSKACYLLERLSKKTNIIGFDLVEVASPEKDFEDWNCNVGARMLFELCLATLSTAE